MDTLNRTIHVLAVQYTDFKGHIDKTIMFSGSVNKIGTNKISVYPNGIMLFRVKNYQVKIDSFGNRTFKERLWE